MLIFNFNLKKYFKKNKKDRIILDLNRKLMEKKIFKRKLKNLNNFK